MRNLGFFTRDSILWRRSHENGEAYRHEFLAQGSLIVGLDCHEIWGLSLEYVASYGVYKMRNLGFLTRDLWGTLGTWRRLGGGFSNFRAYNAHELFELGRFKTLLFSL